jgi:tetratricopeptide (TPR) repeat protein
MAYARALDAGSKGASEEAARGYATALALSPGNEVLASRAFAEALDAGNRELALSAARKLDDGGPLNPDIRLLLLGEALRGKDWKRASTHIEAIEKDEIFAFMAPLLRAWIAVDTGKGDPFASFDAGQANALAASYIQEHRPLLLLAAGRLGEGAAELKKVVGANNMRDQRLRIAGASLLARKGKKREALDLLSGDVPALAVARQRIEERRGVPGEIGSARTGAAELLIRIAGDLHRQNIEPLALRFARVATFLAPENSETWLVTSDILSAAEQHDSALAALEHVAPSDPFAGVAADARIRLLVANGRSPEAVAEAEAAAKAEGSASDWIRLGELYVELDRPEEASAAFDRALALPAGDGYPQWALHLLRGSAFDEAGNWPEAKAALEAAYKLAPQEAIVLNYLGYAQLERRENIDQAMVLIAEASKLQPDSAEITDSLGWAHYLRGDVPKAIELLERAVEGQPADPAINEHLGDAYYRAGRRYEARYAWRAAAIHAEDGDAVRLHAKIEAGLTPALSSP